MVHLNVHTTLHLCWIPPWLVSVHFHQPCHPAHTIAPSALREHLTSFCTFGECQSVPPHQLWKHQHYISNNLSSIDRYFGSDGHRRLSTRRVGANHSFFPNPFPMYPHHWSKQWFGLYWRATIANPWRCCKCFEWCGLLWFPNLDYPGKLLTRGLGHKSKGLFT